MFYNKCKLLRNENKYAYIILIVQKNAAKTLCIVSIIYSYITGVLCGCKST